MLKVLTYATDIDNLNILDLQSTLNAEILPTLLPWTMDFYPKSYAVREYLRDYDIDLETLILVCDAYDVLCMNNCSLKKLEEKIISYFDLDKVTFNAEINCYPDSKLSIFYPHVDGKWKYLNAGMYVGKAKNIISMLDQVLPKMIGSMDQLEFSKFFLEKNLINLDYRCEVFQTLYSGTIGGDIDFSDFIIDGQLIYNKHYNTLPLLFHGNGKINMSGLVNKF